MFRIFVIGFVLQVMFAGPLWADGADVLAEERARAAERLEAERAQLIEGAPEGSQRELAVVRSKISEANESLAIENRVLNRKQRDLELKDPIAKGLREKVLAREKELIELRRSLKSRLDAIPEIQDLQRQRGELVEKIKALHERERELLTAARSDPAAEK